MANWIPSSIQKRLLRYALNRSGLLDVTGIDLDNLDISWGRRTTLEFKNVNLNVEYLAGLAHLPPNLRLESARILLLRLTIPADLINSSISVESDGVDVVAKLFEEEDVVPAPSTGAERIARNTQSPSHRKTTRRIQSPPPALHGDNKIPTTEDLARSFLADEPPEERQELEASLPPNSKAMDESVFSESSEGSDAGTGTAPGLPGFLSSWLQRLIDRFELKTRSVQVSLEVHPPATNVESSPVNFLAKLERLDLLAGPDGSAKREIQFGELSIELVADRQMLSDLSHIPSPPSPTASRATKSSRQSEDVLNQSLDDFMQNPSSSAHDMTISSISEPGATSAMFAEPSQSGGEDQEGMAQSLVNDLDIRVGEDNISWTSRRSQEDGPGDDPWSQSTEDDLPGSLLLGMNYPLPQSRTSVASSSPARSRRAVSPYGRSFQSPGSWPRMEESPQHSRTSQGPGSWPTLEQSQSSSVYQSMMAGSPADSRPPSDDNPNASVHDLASPPTGPSLASSVDEGRMANMEQSRYFSNEEAKSIYMSAVVDNHKEHMPGAWESEIASRVGFEEPATSSVSGPEEDQDITSNNDTPEQQPVMHDDRQVHQGAPSEAATPRATTPTPPSPLPSNQKHSTDELRQLTVQLVHVNAISVFFPRQETGAAAPVDAPSQPAHAQTFAASQSLAMSRAGMPGAFSVYSQLSRSQRRGEASVLADRESFTSRNPSSNIGTPETDHKVEARIGAVKVQVDVPTVQLLYKMSNTFTTGSKTSGPSSNVEKQASVEMAITVQSFHLSLHQKIEQHYGQQSQTRAPGLLSLNCQHFQFDSKPLQRNIKLGLLEAYVGETKVLSFDPDPQALTESMVFHEDLRVSIDTSKRGVQGRPITNIGVECRPIQVNIDLSAFDEAFSAFGGLSGVLDIGSSMASEVSPLASPAVPGRPQRVRFEEEPEPDSKSSEFKANAGIAGFTLVFSADDTSIEVQSKTIKAIYREQAASVRFFGSLRLSGPYFQATKIATIHIDLAELWVHYLFTPQEQDLERLLALITPSKDKYDNDDDILVETLLRQRRKGACLRVTVEDLKVNVDSFECLTTLQALSAQVARLSAVTKYLPEDERPGLLSLIRVKQMEVRLPVNDRFGTLQVTAKELQCAHVGLPALLALSLSNVGVIRPSGHELVHALVPLTGSDDLPMIMARMLSDEAEPTAKVKLYNICVEYSVPTLMDLLGLNPSSDSEEIVTELATSVVSLVAGRQDKEPAQDEDVKSGQATLVHLLLHNSAIGLTPQNAPSKGLLVLTDARLSTSVPPRDTVDVDVDLRQAGILITDDAHALRSELFAPSRNPPQSTSVDTRILNILWKEGYASVGSIMSAHIKAHVEKGILSGQDFIEVDVRNDFFLLETCADSFQTLISVMSGLSPPTPPSKEQKYLTEPVSIDDMISSFSGDAYAQPEKPGEMLFDAEEAAQFPDSDIDNDSDGLLSDADMSSSLYGPIGGMMDDLPAGKGQVDQDYGDTVESLLDDDPFEMTTSPDDMPFSDSALLRDLRQQALPAKRSEPVNLGKYEIEDLGFDALGVDERALGSRNRFCAPTSQRKVGKSSRSMEKLPFKLRLRDVNVTWHMHDGYDWQRTRDGITTAVERVEQQAEERLARRRQARVEPEDEESTIGDCMFNSVYITIPNNFTEPSDIRRGINRQIDDLASESESVPASGISRPTAFSAGGRPIHSTRRRRLKLERSRYHKISFELKGVSVDLDVLPPGSGELQSSIEVGLKQFEIYDNVPTSTWKKFLTQKHIEGTQEIARPMVHIELLNRKTILERDATELLIHVAVQPLRLHVDQDALDFITRFTEFKDHANEPSSPSEQPFLARVEIETVDLQLDYKPKKIDYAGLRSGRATEFMNFIILDQANIRLKHAIVYGIHGFEPLHNTLNDVWMPDVKRNQLPTILAGLAPVRSLVNIGSGVRDVVAIPIQQYRKDGRIVRSVQKGAFRFGKTTASELARLGAKVAIGTQNILSGAEGLLAPQSTRLQAESPADDLEDEDREPRAISAYAEQPLGVLSGLKSARRYLEHDLLTARDALIAVQGEFLESANPGSAAMAVARHAPTVVLRPVMGVSKAIGTTLLGVGNQIDRSGVKKMEDKYKRR
ncbi:hypothetical protein Q7P37_004000 [Cladosporium fusiforme]